MTHTCYRRDPNINAVTDLVTDEQMQAAFTNTNFGHTDYRGLLSQGCIKALAGWHQGHTITCILEELRLISWNRQSSKIKITAKGRHYIWLAFNNPPGEPSSEKRYYAANTVDRLVRELDVLLNGEEGAAPQAMLCDIVSQVRHNVDRAAVLAGRLEGVGGQHG